ncbi:uncharacterized protein [Arachis hypogaea]|uniref:uncharacterized protein isoform X2 n=1 Tax=Arachis hypogaea TaxID=3818 RepID=UPI000DEC564D|nr:uncharacterized protein LOC112756015 isoform X2 [Arachis hypogaea]
MASSTTKPQKRIRDFLTEQQEPFILEVYLLERQHSSKWWKRFNGDSDGNKSSNNDEKSRKRKKAMLPFYKVLLPYGKKGNSLWSNNEDQNLFSSETFQRQHQKRIESSLVSMGKIPVYRIPHAAIWNLLGESVKKENCTNTNKQSAEFLIRPNTSKKVVQKIKRLLCARERDISIVAIPTKQEKVKQCYKGPICEGKKECGRQGANLKTMDYLSSIDEWRNMEEQVKAISVEITDHILEGINNEIVLEFIATWADQS